MNMAMLAETGEITVTEAAKPDEYKTYLERIYSKACRNETEYTCAEDIVADIVRSSTDDTAFNRLFCFAYPLMKHISQYLMFSNTLKEQKSSFKYQQLDDKNLAEEEIVFGFLKVLKDIRSDIGIVKDKSLKHIRNILLKRIRHASSYNAYKAVLVNPHQDRFSVNSKKKTIYLEPQKLDLHLMCSGGFSLVIENDCERFILRKAVEFIRSKSREEKVIFFLTVLKTSKYKGKDFVIKLADAEIAEIAGVTIEAVQLVKRRFWEFWNKEIASYVQTNFSETKNSTGCEKYIQSKINEFLCSKNKVEKMIFYLAILKAYRFRGALLPYEITDQDVAELLGTTKRVVEYTRNQKLLQEFRKFWEEEISPYL